MKHILLLIGFFPLLALSQTMTLTDVNGQNIANTTVIVNVFSSDIIADNMFKAEYHAYVNNISSSSISARIERESYSLSGNSVSEFCANGICYPPTTTYKNYTLAAGASDYQTYYYRPNGSLEDASVTYLHTYTGSSIQIRITVHYHIVDNSGIKEALKGMNLSAFPNPANDKVEIAYKATEASQIVLYNIVGTKVKSFNVSAGTSSIEIATDALPAGTYFYSLINKQGTETKRLVIKH